MRDDVHPGWAVYDLDRLRANLAEIRRRIGPDQACTAPHQIGVLRLVLNW
jgi:hypothetical protein